jgi:Tryptophan-associated transmembrane protein (Trp_oprn_chp)
VLVLLAVSAVAGIISEAGPADGLVVLAVATAPALFAVPPRGRLPLGLVVVAAAVLAPVLSADEADLAAWAAAAALAGAGALLAWRGPSWPPLSRRYERGASPAEATSDPRDLWKALDRGEDPTGESPER